MVTWSKDWRKQMLIFKMSFLGKTIFCLPLCHLTLLPRPRHAGREPTPKCYSPSLHCTAPKHKGDASALSHAVFRKEVQGKNVTIANSGISTRGKLVWPSEMATTSEQILISSKCQSGATELVCRVETRGLMAVFMSIRNGRRYSNCPGCQAVQLHSYVTCVALDAVLPNNKGVVPRV